MGRRGRKPKEVVEPETPSEPVVVKKRGRRSKKQPTVSDIISLDKDILLNSKIDPDDVVNEISTIRLEPFFKKASKATPKPEDCNYLFKLETTQITVIKPLFEALKDMLAEANIQCDSEGLRSIAANKKKGIVVFLQLFGSKFEDYACYKKSLSLGLNLDALHKIVKPINNTTTLTLMVEQDSPEHLQVIVNNSEEGKRKKSTIKLLDLDIPETNLGQNNRFDMVIYMSAVKFQKTCREIISSNNDKVSIMAYNKTLTLSCDCEDSEDTIEAQEITLVETPEYLQFVADSGGIVQGEYSLKDILSFTKCNGVSGGGIMKIYMHNDLPLVIEYNVGGLGYMKLVINPLGA